MKEFFTGIFYFFITIGVFVLTYYATKYISKRAGMLTKSKNLQVMEKVALGKDKQVAILRVGDEYFLIGITNQSLQLGSPLTRETVESLRYEDAKTQVEQNFSQTLENVINKNNDFLVNGKYRYKGLLSTGFIQKIIIKVTEMILKVIKKVKGDKNDS